MKKLRSFHEEHLSVEHTFSLFDQIAYYESLWEGEPSVYRDYSTTKAHVLELEACLDAQPKVWTLTHIDAVPDNFLFVEKNGGTEMTGNMRACRMHMWIWRCSAFTPCMTVRRWMR